MSHPFGIVFLCAAALALGACVTPTPAGPSVMVLPGHAKTWSEFQNDDATCRGFAQQQIPLSPDQQRAQSAITGAAVGTAVGAAAGAAIGAAAHDPGAGAAIGAGTGLLVGSSSGAEQGEYSARELQRRYDYSYMQCMYANGNQIPVARRSGGYYGPTPPVPPEAPSPRKLPPAPRPPRGSPPPPPPG
jgi:hypothetical protein